MTSGRRTRQTTGGRLSCGAWGVGRFCASFFGSAGLCERGLLVNKDGQSVGGDQRVRSGERYFHKMPGQPGADNTLLYFLAHKSNDAGKASFDTFRKDPAWITAKDASETGGPLTVKDGVKSVYLVPTDYSPTK